MSRLAVLHLSRGREWRGGERQVRLLATTQHRHGDIAPLVVTGRTSELSRQLDLDGIPVRRVDWSISLDPRALLGAAAAIRSLRRTNLPLVLHAHDSHALQVALPLARGFDLPLVATRRSDTAPGVLWRLPARIIAISGAVAARLVSAGVDPSRIADIPSAVDLTNASALRQRSSPEPLVVAAGALTPEKGHRVLLEAFARVADERHDARLIIAGDGPERVPLEALARSLNLLPRVHFAGAVPEAMDLIARAAILVQPSRREALGTALLEAMALGVPVIASATGGPAELLADGHGVLVPPGDAARLAAAISELLADPALRAELRHRGLALVRRYDIAVVAAAVAGVYRSALNQP
jgi:glycosyltransferase involved in cell wall biosynthesis